jgi:hypothetical protein
MTAVYIQNRSPHRILKSMISEEAFFGKKPSVEHLRIFRCPVYIHVPKDKMKKLEPSGKKGIFVGYSDTSKAYRIYVPSQQKIEINRDVTFDEKIAFKKSIEDPIDSNDEEEYEDPKEESTCSPKDPSEEPDQPLEPVEPVVVPRNQKRLAWLESTLQEAERHKAPSGTFRESKRPKRFSSYATLMTSLVNAEPSTFEEAVKKKEWKEAMVEEYQSIMKNDVWEIVPRPEGKSVVTSKWVSKIKHAVDGSIDKYKARFVARGFSQQEGEDYDETFAPVARYTSIGAIISLATSMGWSLHQMDVKTAFLNGVIEEEVYIEKPQGFEVHPRETHVCRLKKALYGLKQAPRAWYARIDSYLTRLVFSKSYADPNLYYKVVNDAPMILLLYVDDLFMTGAESLIIQCKKELASEFDMKDLGLMHYYLGLEVWQKRGEILRYASNSDVKLHGFTDSDWAGSVDDRKSTSSICFSLGFAMISWASRKQKFVALNTAEAEYIAACDACTEATWLRKMVFGLFDQVLDSTVIHCDNQSCMKLSENPVFHDRLKHIEIKYYFLHDKVQKGEVILQYTSIDEQTTDILMKPLSKIKFVYLRDKLGLMEISPLVEREEMTSSIGREC